MMKSVLFSLFVLAMLLLFFGCDKKNDSASNLDIETPTFSGKVVQWLGQSDEKYLIGNKSYFYNPERPNENFAYADIINIGSKLFLAAHHTENQIGDHLQGQLTIAESSDEGKTWGNFTSIAQGFENAINVSAPSFLKISDKHVFIFYLVKYSTQRIDIYSQESFDECKTWSVPKVVFKTNIGYQILNNSRVQYIDKKIIVPLSFPQTGDISAYYNSNNGLKIFYYSSNDLGKTWQKSKALSSNINLLEPGITSFSNQNEWLMNVRTDKGKILFIRSLDYGRTWKFEDSNIQSPSSPQSLFYDDVRDVTFMAWNHTSTNSASHGNDRSPLTLAISYDKGYSWKTLFDVEPKGSLYDYSYIGLKKVNERIFLVYNERNNQTGKFKVKVFWFQ